MPFISRKRSFDCAGAAHRMTRILIDVILSEGEAEVEESFLTIRLWGKRGCRSNAYGSATPHRRFSDTRRTGLPQIVPGRAVARWVTTITASRSSDSR